MAVTPVPVPERRVHPLRAADRQWPETNCYSDLWIGLLLGRGLEPLAGLSFTAAVDFEGDQVTFFKPPPDDLRALYGLAVQELALYRPLAEHAAVQLALGRAVLPEVDSHYLPDTAGTAYRRQHVKTTIGIDGPAALDIAGRRLAYLHNAGAFTLEGGDFDGLFHRPPDALPPYVEVVKAEAPPLAGAALRAAALERLAGHLRRRPRPGPVAGLRAALPGALGALAGGPMDAFHAWAFATLRQLGAAFELLGGHLDWLEAGGPLGLAGPAGACRRVAGTAKAMQFQLARTVHRGRTALPDALLDEAESALAAALDGLAARVA